MSKQSTITSFIVMPLIASAIFLASPTAFGSGPGNIASRETKNSGGYMVKHTQGAPGGHKGIAGTVTAINGSILTVSGVDKINYTIDATNATIMKAGADPATNPDIVNIKDIHVGDTIMVRGTVMMADRSTLTAEKIFDGHFPATKDKKIMHRPKNRLDKLQ